MDESERLIAVLKGSYVARVFPETWYKLQKRDEIMKQSLKEQVAEKIKHDENRRKYGIKKSVPSKRDIQELLVRIEKLLIENKE